MGVEYSQSFNLPALLTLEGLEILEFANNNPVLPAREYFSLLYKFTYIAPKASGALAKIIARNYDNEAIQSLTEMKMLSKSIGCKKFISSFNEIVTAIQSGSMNHATLCAEKILDEFNGFCTQIMAAKKEEKQELLPNKDSNINDMFAFAYGNQPLKEVLASLDHEEANRKLRILAVDDSPVMIKTISSVLDNTYKVYGITNPLLVENFLKQITPELFILDYKMPRLNGFDLVPIIRRFHDHRKTPIIFLTSLGTIDNISTALQIGASDFIVKPFEPDKLREKVAKHIVRKSSF